MRQLANFMSFHECSNISLLGGGVHRSCVPMNTKHFGVNLTLYFEKYLKKIENIRVSRIKHAIELRIERLAGICYPNYDFAVLYPHGRWKLRVRSNVILKNNMGLNSEAHLSLELTEQPNSDVAGLNSDEKQISGLKSATLTLTLKCSLRSVNFTSKLEVIVENLLKLCPTFFLD